MTTFGVERVHLWDREHTKLEWRIAQYTPVGEFALHASTSVIELIQMSGFAFAAKTPPVLQEVQRWAESLRALHVPVLSLDATLGLAYGFVTALVVLLFVQARVRTLTVWYPSIGAMKTAWLFMTGVFKLSMRALLLPLVSILVVPFACTRLPTGVYTLDIEPAIHCWEGGRQLVHAAAAAACLVVYTLLSIRLNRVGLQLSQVEVRANLLDWAGDRFNPRYRHPLSPYDVTHATVLGLVKLMLLFMIAFLRNHTLIVSACSFICGVVLLTVGLQYPPFYGGTRSRANTWRSSIDTVISWLYLCGMVIAVAPDDSHLHPGDGGPGRVALTDVVLAAMVGALLLCLLPGVMCRHRARRARCGRCTDRRTSSTLQHRDGAGVKSRRGQKTQRVSTLLAARGVSSDWAAGTGRGTSNADLHLGVIVRAGQTPAAQLSARSTPRAGQSPILAASPHAALLASASRRALWNASSSPARGGKPAEELI